MSTAASLLPRPSGDRMANLILEDLLRRGAEVVSAGRPVVAMLVSVFRVT
jgi:hypothetical protein